MSLRLCEILFLMQQFSCCTMVKRGKYEKKYNESSSKSLSIPTLITHSADSYFAILWKGITTLNTSYLAFFNKKAQSIKIGLFNESGLSTLRIYNFEQSTNCSIHPHIPKPLPQAHHYGNGTHHQAY